MDFNGFDKCFVINRVGFASHHLGSLAYPCILDSPSIAFSNNLHTAPFFIISFSVRGFFHHSNRQFQLKVLSLKSTYLF